MEFGSPHLGKCPVFLCAPQQSHDLCPLIEVTVGVVKAEAPGIVLLDIMSHLINWKGHQKTLFMSTD